MLFNNPPVNASLSALAASAYPGQSRRRHLFTHGTDLYWVLLNVSGSAPGVLLSTDGGLTWTAQDTGFSLPDAVNVFPDLLEDTLYIGIESDEIISGDLFVVYRVAKFDLATNTYSSLSDGLTVISGDPNILYQGSPSGAVASNGDFHLLVSFFHVGSGFTNGPLAYYAESGGSWSGSYTVLDPDYSKTDRDALGRRDSAGDLHWFYEHWVTSLTGFAGHFDDHYPIELRHVKEGGSPSTIQSVAPPVIPAGPAATQFDIYDGLAVNGKLYVSNTREGSAQAIWVSDSDTNPTAWSEVMIDAAAGAGGGSFAYDPTADELHIVYGLPVSSLWRSTLAAGIWSAPDLAYDPADNPVTDMDSVATNPAFTINAVMAEGRLAVGATYAVSGASNAIFLSSGSGIVQNYCF